MKVKIKVGLNYNAYTANNGFISYCEILYLATGASALEVKVILSVLYIILITLHLFSI